jgi:hypothetical protein
MADRLCRFGVAIEECVGAYWERATPLWRNVVTSASVLACRNPTSWPNLVRLIHQV